MISFAVPSGMCAQVRQALLRQPGSVERKSETQRRFDTPDGRLEHAGLRWCAVRHGRLWRQRLEARDADEDARSSPKVPALEAAASNGMPDPTAFAANPLAMRLQRLLAAAEEDGLAYSVRDAAELRITTRRVRSGAAVVDIRFEEGRLVSGDAFDTVRRLTFARCAGPSSEIFTLADRWQRRYDLKVDPRTLEQRRRRLASGVSAAPVRRAARPSFSKRDGAGEAFRRTLDECLQHLDANLIGLLVGDEASRAEHVHQARVAIRRLRSASRCFSGWVPEAPAAAIEDLRWLFSQLGHARDADVLSGGVAAGLAQVGAPQPVAQARSCIVDSTAIAGAVRTQRCLLSWTRWRRELDDNGLVAAEHPPASHGDAARAADRLRRWHRRIVALARRVETLDEEALHSLRKRIKRQRYAVEFFEPWLRREEIDRYLAPLSVVQEGMGELNDLFTARSWYQARAAEDPAHWFALGWLAARIVPARAAVGPALLRLAAREAPRARRHAGVKMAPSPQRETPSANGSPSA